VGHGGAVGRLDNLPLRAQSPPHQTQREGTHMGKVIDCHKVNPTTDCQHVVRGATEEEVLQKAGEHAKEHGLAPSPELLAQVKSFIEDD